MRKSKPLSRSVLDSRFRGNDDLGAFPTNFRKNRHGFSDITVVAGYHPASLEESIPLIINRLAMPFEDYCELELFLQLNKNH